MIQPASSETSLLMFVLFPLTFTPNAKAAEANEEELADLPHCNLMRKKTVEPKNDVADTLEELEAWFDLSL